MFYGILGYSSYTPATPTNFGKIWDFSISVVEINNLLVGKLLAGLWIFGTVRISLQILYREFAVPLNQVDWYQLPHLISLPEGFIYWVWRSRNQNIPFFRVPVLRPSCNFKTCVEFFRWQPKACLPPCEFRFSPSLPCFSTTSLCPPVRTKSMFQLCDFQSFKMWVFAKTSPEFSCRLRHAPPSIPSSPSVFPAEDNVQIQIIF